MLQFPFPGLHPEQMRTGLLVTFMMVRFSDSPMSDGEQVPKKPARDRRRIDEQKVFR
jgi:hypothetical protein